MSFGKILIIVICAILFPIGWVVLAALYMSGFFEDGAA